MPSIQPLSVLIHLGDPKKNLAETLAFRPAHHSLDERTADALAAKTGVDPQRGQRGGALELTGTSPHGADHLAFDLRHETGPLPEALPPALLTRPDLGRVGRAKCVRRLYEGGKPELAKDLPLVGADAANSANCRG